MLLDELVKNFHQQVKRRIDRYKKLYSFGEDSIRYDFYYTALKQFDLDPTEIILEQPLPATQFIPKSRDLSTLKQGRHIDKPEFDLRIDPASSLPFGILAEFAFFRKTEISQNQDKSARHGKLLNEIHRLALLKHFRNHENNSLYEDFSGYKCLLVCVTDNEMIHYGKNNRGPKAIPIQKSYELTKNYLMQFPNTVLKALDEKFLAKVNDLNIVPRAEMIYELHECENIHTPMWATWVWDVSYL